MEASLSDLIHAVKTAGLDGLVAKRKDVNSKQICVQGAWPKIRINQGQEFVIGGYTLGSTTFDALVFGYYEHDKLNHAARTRNGFKAPSARSFVPNARD